MFIYLYTYFPMFNIYLLFNFFIYLIYYYLFMYLLASSAKNGKLLCAEQPWFAFNPSPPPN